MSPGATVAPKAAAADSTPPWLSHAGTVVAVAFSASCALVAVAFGATAAEQAGAPQTWLYVLGTLVGLALAGLLVMRRRHPVVLCVVASAAAVVLPIDSSAALLSLPWVIAASSVRTIAACTVLTGAGTTMALTRDALRAPGDMVFAVLDQQTGAVTAHPGPGVFVAAGIVLLGLSVGAGIVRRSRGTARLAVEQQEARATTAAVLRDQMSRQEERALIAREVHDTVAHHIAAISLQASALQVTRAEDAETTDAAREIRASAQRAIAELRALLSTLRDGDPDATPLPGTNLDDLAPMLDQLRHDGAQIASTVFVSGADQARPEITRAVFRIVQESVTNAVKHAPGERCEVTVRAAPDHGVAIRVSNPLAAPHGRDRDGLGTGSGLIGMRERAAAVGGHLDAGPVDGTFLVTAELPWGRSAASPAVHD